MIYFVRDPASGLVKIGYSGNAWSRLSKIQSDTPGALIVEAVVHGERADEAALHVAFGEQRVRGEWFRWAGPVSAHVSALEGLTRPSKHDSRKREINKALFALGYGSPYASQLQNGRREWPLRVAVGVWAQSGHKLGPVADATDAELLVLAKFTAREHHDSSPERRAA